MKMKELLKSDWMVILTLIIAVAIAALAMSIAPPGPAEADERFSRSECMEECAQDHPPNDPSSRRFYVRCVQQCEKTYWCIDKCEENHEPGTDACKKCAEKCVEKYRY